MRRLLHWLVPATAWFAVSIAIAQDFPARPVTLIMPWPAGGSTDLAMRALATATEKYMGQTIVVENKPGAAGTLGATAMVTAKPDGYTVTQIPITVFRNPHVTKVGYDPLTDLTYLIGISGYTFGVVVRSDEDTVGQHPVLPATLQQRALDEEDGGGAGVGDLQFGHRRAVGELGDLAGLGKCRAVRPAVQRGVRPYRKDCQRTGLNRCAEVKTGQCDHSVPPPVIASACCALIVSRS